MNAETIKLLTDLEAKATAGPWIATDLGDGYEPKEPDVRICQADLGDNCICCLALMGNTIDEVGEKWTPETVAQWKADADLLVELRNHARDLLAAAAEAEGWRMAMETAVAECREWREAKSNGTLHLDYSPMDFSTARQAEREYAAGVGFAIVATDTDPLCAAALARAALDKEKSGSEAPAPACYHHTVDLVSHMDLPDGVRWATNGYYLKLRNGQYRYVCGLTELTEPASSPTPPPSPGR